MTEANERGDFPKLHTDKRKGNFTTRGASSQTKADLVQWTPPTKLLVFARGRTRNEAVVNTRKDRHVYPRRKDQEDPGREQ